MCLAGCCYQVVPFEETQNPSLKITGGDTPALPQSRLVWVGGVKIDI